MSEITFWEWALIGAAVIVVYVVVATKALDSGSRGN